MDPEQVEKYFDVFDYIVFAAMLLISALIGVYFAFFAKVKQNTTSEYLMGSKTMGIFPISMSLIASYISGISILGIPAEMYTYGTQFWMIITSECLVSITMAVAYLPVFYTLQITSSYEYLNLRFNQTVRLLGSTLFLLKMLLYIPIVIYVPALAFSQVTGINLHLITPIVCIVCIFYTTLGGLKAVVWTDTIQTVVMFGALIVVIIMGNISIGGFEEVWSRNDAGGRLEFFNLDWDPTIRHSFWTVSIGNYFGWLASCSINQAMVQRCLAMPSLASARVTIGILVIGIMILASMCCYMGLLIFASYHKCDPITRGSIAKSDQLLPYFVMKIAGAVPGLPGLFVSGVFSAALSSMSTGLNSMTGVIFEDLIKPHIKKPLSESHASFLMKVIVVLIGSICVGLVFLVEKMGALIQASGSLAAITAGPLLGIFTLGMFFPFANPKGALAGGILSGTLVGWISIGTQLKMANKEIIFPQKPVSVEGCNANWIAEYLSSAVINEGSSSKITEEPFFLYQLSYMYYTALGAIVAIIIGILVSYLTGCNKNRLIHKDLLSPVVHRFLPEQKSEIPEDKDVKNHIKLSQLSSIIN
ncbi:PREDICTED: sodium-coupled monocarboxylate transporter 1-like [Nicrophorus vespilloides]|uniref:Sodium-coupled monocarboxylate transporter 1-like n=1 Tax=Nicrophorus vespilloides TaxID=110193 RepID=A0ABM1ND98_NICVS|nr:PREDICTED: sodium-coupled monocarboxylate transporter 1-like [Nicrophorus vespilloides]